jgi:hypothetical protein
MERNFVHFLSFKKNWNFRPIILGNMDIKKKERLSGIWDKRANFTAVKIGRELRPQIGRC